MLRFKFSDYCAHCRFPLMRYILHQVSDHSCFEPRRGLLNWAKIPSGILNYMAPYPKLLLVQEVNI